MSVRNAPGVLGGNWVSKAVKKPGQLHRDLGIPQGQKIPESKLESVDKGNSKVAQRARFAENAKKFKH